MSRLPIRSLALALAALAILAVATTSRGAPAPRPSAVLGPPWISIEYPVNPYDRTTRDAYLLVHAFHHGNVMDAPVSGTAEGIVGGQRRHVVLAFEKSSRPGVFALRRQWDSAGVWTLVIAVSQGHGDGDQAQALVEIGGDGRIAQVTVPTKQERDWTVPRQITAAEVERSLQARAARLASGR